jgi:hypothetical protein
MFNKNMSDAKTISENLKPLTSTTPETNKVMRTSRVDINHLIARVRKEKDKENKINLIILCSFAALVFIIGIILSF